MDYESYRKYMYIFVCTSVMFTCGVSQITIRSGNTNENRTTYIGLAYITQFDNKNYTLAKFLGISYAQPPVGEKRFAKPVPLDQGDANYDATQLKSICYQRLNTNDQCQKANTMDEDCLYLNVYVPLVSTTPLTASSVDNATMSLSEVKNKLAVFVFIHGGAYIEGAGNCFDGSVLAGFGEIIVVTVNYRLNVFGFLSTDDEVLPANVGLWDQHQAIRWVSENIQAFGGDPTRITVGGQSSGAYSAVFQGMFSGNDDLFQRIISESGTPASPKGVIIKGYATARNLANSLGCNITLEAKKSSEIKSCLMKQNATSLAQAVTPPIVPFTLGLEPTLDGNFATVDPFTMLAMSTERDSAVKVPDGFRKKDLLIGFNAEDGEVILRLRAREKFYETNNASVITEAFGVPLSREAWRQLIFEILAKSSDDHVDSVLIDAVLDKYMDWGAPDDLEGLSNRVVRMLTDVVFAIPAVNTALSHVLSAGNVTSTIPGVGNTASVNTPATNTTVSNSTAINSTAINSTAINSTAVDSTAGTTFVYKFTLPTTNEFYFKKSIAWFSGTEHSDEIPFVFGKVVISGSIEIAKSVMQYWSNFIKTGNPNMGAANNITNTSVYWKEFTVTEQNYLEISSTSESRNRVDSQSHHFWYDFLPSLEQRLKQIETVATTSPAARAVTCGANSGSGLKVNLQVMITIAICGLLGSKMGKQIF